MSKTLTNQTKLVFLNHGYYGPISMKERQKCNLKVMVSDLNLPNTVYTCRLVTCGSCSDTCILQGNIVILIQ